MSYDLKLILPGIPRVYLYTPLLYYHKITRGLLLDSTGYQRGELPMASSLLHRKLMMLSVAVRSIIWFCVRTHEKEHQFDQCIRDCWQRRVSSTTDKNPASPTATDLGADVCADGATQSCVTSETQG